MSTLEAALRGGAIAILLLTVGLHAGDLLTNRLRRYSALFQLCAVAYIVDSAPGFDALDLRWRMPIHIVSSSAPAMFWIVTAALFIITSVRIFWGEQLLPTSTPLPTYAYPLLVATFVGWIWTLWREPD